MHVMMTDGNVLFGVLGKFDDDAARKFGEELAGLFVDTDDFCSGFDFRLVTLEIANGESEMIYDGAHRSTRRFSLAERYQDAGEHRELDGSGLNGFAAEHFDPQFSMRLRIRGDHMEVPH